MQGSARPARPSSYQLAGTAEGFCQVNQVDLVVGDVPGYSPGLTDAARGLAVA